jgi:hypothetical protein
VLKAALSLLNIFKDHFVKTVYFICVSGRKKKSKHFLAEKIVPCIFLSQVFCKKLFDLFLGNTRCQVWCCVPLIPVFWRLKQEDHEFEASLGCPVSKQEKERKD